MLDDSVAPGSQSSRLLFLGLNYHTLSITDIDVFARKEKPGTQITTHPITSSHDDLWPTYTHGVVYVCIYRLEIFFSALFVRSSNMRNQLVASEPRIPKTDHSACSWVTIGPGISDNIPIYRFGNSSKRPHSGTRLWCGVFC